MHLDCRKIAENADWETTERAVAKIEEEIFADAFGNMNAFGAGADRFTETARSEVNGTVGTENAAATERKTGPPAQFSEDEKEYMKPFAEQLRDFMDKENRRTIFGKDALLIGETPKIFRDIGLITLPVAINQTHVSYAIDEAYEGPEKYKAGHTFTIEEFSKLPEKLADPVAIIPDPSKNDLIVYVDMENAAGEQTIVPFRMNTRTFLGNQKIDVQLAKSVFGADDAENVLIRAIERDSEDDIRIYYVNKGKIPPGIDSAVRKHGGHVPDGIIHSINDAGSPVKSTIHSQTETLQFKRWFAGSKVVNADGTPKVVYHQTGADFTVFNTDNPLAGLNDSETPNGIFFKDNDHDIGLEGRKQMAVYLDMKKPLHFANREAANRWYCEHINGYRDLQNEMKAKLKPFDDRLQSLEDQMFKEETDEARYDELDAEWNAELERMRDVETEYRGKLRELLNDYFLKSDSGYDGIILDYDGHRYVDGKRESVKSYIVFKNTQAKSATDNIGTYDRNNPDIRFSEDEDVPQSAAEYAQQRNREPQSSAEYARMRQRELLEEKELQRLENKAKTSAEARKALAEARRYKKEKEKPRKREMRIRGYGGEVGI